MWAIVPLKDFNQVKQRLGSLLSVIERRSLFRAMVEDLLSSLQACPQISKIVIVTDDPCGRYLAKQINAEVLSEQQLGASGMNGVIQAAFETLSMRTNQEIMIIHGDLPLVTEANLSELIGCHHALATPGVTVATDEHAQGSNCLILPAKSDFSFAYGQQSLPRHQIEAVAQGLNFQQCQIHGIACDIDYPQDLLNVLKNTDPLCAVLTKGYLEDSGISARFASSTLTQIRDSQHCEAAVVSVQTG
jgi:2-phospho-L-lactate guanylyltransferase